MEPMEPPVDPPLHWNPHFQNPRSATALSWRKSSLIRIGQKATPPEDFKPPNLAVINVMVSAV